MQSLPNQIYLYPQATTGNWMAEHVGPHAETIKELFDTTTLPTPFSLPIQGPAVVECIKSLNPDCHVDWFRTEAAWQADCEATGGVSA